MYRRATASQSPAVLVSSAATAIAAGTARPT